MTVFFLLEMMTYLKNVANLLKVVSADVEKEFESKSVYLRKKFESKIKLYMNEAIDFHYEEMLKAGSNHTILVVIKIDSAVRNDFFAFIYLFQ